VEAAPAVARAEAPAAVAERFRPPLLVRSTVAAERPQLHLHAVARGPGTAAHVPGHVRHRAGDYVVVPAVGGTEPPLLVEAVLAGALLDRGAVGHRPVGLVGAERAVDVLHGVPGRGRDRAAAGALLVDADVVDLQA